MQEENVFLESKKQEYAMLRKEIEDIMKTQTTLFNICVTAVAGVIAFSISGKEPNLIITSDIIVFFILLRYLRTRHGFLYLSAYMIVYLEPIIGIDWETNNYARYLLERNDATPLQLLFQKPRHLVWCALSCISLITYVFVASDSLEFSLILLHTFFIVITLLQSIELAKADTIREKEVNKWISLRSKIQVKSKHLRDRIVNTNSNLP